MKSRISIDVDYDNQPIIKIEYEHSEDVRDKLVKKFMETFGGASYFCTFFFTDGHLSKPNREAYIRPVHPHSLKDHWQSMKMSAEEQERMASRDCVESGSQSQIVN